MIYEEIMDNFVDIFETDNFFPWIFTSSIILLVILGLMFLIIRIYYQNKAHSMIEANSKSLNIEEMASKIANKPYEISQVIFEIIISNTSITVIMYFYFHLEKFTLISDYFNILMLVLIAIAVLVNNIIDNKFEQDILSKGDKATIRLISSISIMVVFLYVKMKFETNQYDQLIICYLGLALGRFIYFDTTLSQLIKSLGDLIKYIPPLTIALFFTYMVGLYGVKYQIIKQSNILLGLVCVHFCMLFCVHFAKRIVYGRI